MSFGGEGAMKKQLAVVGQAEPKPIAEDALCILIKRNKTPDLNHNWEPYRGSEPWKIQET